MTTFYLAADDRTLVVRRDDRQYLKLQIKKHWFAKGLTRTQAALALLEFLTGVQFDRVQKSWRTLPRTVNREPDVAGVLFNEPPQNVRLAHYTFWSLDSASVEFWLRKVFVGYRDCLPLTVNSLQQHSEAWLAERWTKNAFSNSPPMQAAQALAIHFEIDRIIAEKLQAKQQRLRDEQRQSAAQSLPRSEITEQELHQVLNLYSGYSDGRQQ